jgi:hypothetical protein
MWASCPSLILLKLGHLFPYLILAVEDVVKDVTNNIEAVPLDALSFCCVLLLGIKIVL